MRSLGIWIIKVQYNIGADSAMADKVSFFEGKILTFETRERVLKKTGNSYTLELLTAV